MVQSHDVAPSLYCTAISIDSPHIHKDGANYLNLLLLYYLFYAVVKEELSQQVASKDADIQSCKSRESQLTAQLNDAINKARQVCSPLLQRLSRPCSFVLYYKQEERYRSIPDIL